jgi:hypothetical protein
MFFPKNETELFTPSKTFSSVNVNIWVFPEEELQQTFPEFNLT